MDYEAMLLPTLMGVSLTLAFWLCLPDILVLVGLARFRRGVAGGPDDVLTRSGGLLPGEVAQELGTLQFDPAGLYWETVPTHKVAREAVFVSRTGDCFASVYRLFNNDPARVAFTTTFREGAIVFTQNYAGGMQADEETLRAGGLTPQPQEAPAEPQRPSNVAPPAWRWSLLLGGLIVGVGWVMGQPESKPDDLWRWVAVAGLFVFLSRSLRVSSPAPEEKPSPEAPCASPAPTIEVRAPLADVLKEHRRRVANFVESGHTLVRAATIDDFVESQRAYGDHPTVWRTFRESIVVVFPFKLGFLLIAPAALIAFHGVEHLAPWSVLLAESLGVFWFRYYGYHLAQSLDKACDPSGSS